jgi:hypothetical protein
MNHSPSRPDVLLVSPPHPDWRVHGAANVFSQQGSSSPGAASGIARGAALAEWLSLADALVDAGVGSSIEGRRLEISYNPPGAAVDSFG